MKEVLVVITYIAGEAQGSELALAVAGWRKHFKHPHKIVVVGDRPLIEGVEWLPMERVAEKPGEYRPHLDICRKLETVCAIYGDRYSGFVWACDDFFAVNDFTLDDIKIPKFQEAEMPSKGDQHPNSWIRNVVKTRRLCEREKLGVVNWVTHLPVWFDIRHLIMIIWKYDLADNSYVVENIYFNKFRPEGVPQQIGHGDKWKFGVYFSPLDRHGFYDALANKKWVCCSVHGWSDELEQELRKHYGL